MGGNSLCLACPLEHEELRQDSNRLEPDGERPCELKGRVLVVEDEGEQDDGRDEVCEAESVEGGVLCGPCMSAIRPTEYYNLFAVADTGTHLNLTRMRYKVYAVLPIKNSFIKVLYTETC